MMDNSPVPSDRRADALQTDGRVSIDTYILLAVSAVLILTTIVQIVSHLYGNTWLLSIVTVLFIVAALCCVVITARRATTVAQQFAYRRSVSMSAALGSFLSGLFTVVFADVTISHDLFIIIGMFLVIIALCVIGIIIILVKDREEEKTTGSLEPPTRRLPVGTDAYGREKRTRDTSLGSPPRTGISVEQSQLQSEYAVQNYREPGLAQVPAKNLLPPDHESTDSPPPPLPITPQRPQGVLNIMPTTEVSGLSSLFEGDELYAIPRNTRAQLFILTKSKDRLENCEDACAISRDETRFALCDGVSASKFARPWARLLALEWVAQPLAAHDAETLDAWLEKPRRHWLNWVNNTWFVKINERNRSMRRVEFKQDDVKKFITQGAAATFLGLTIDRTTSTWSAIAIGDTCLFHFSYTDAEAWKYESFPLKQSSDFTDGPAIITTRPQSAALAASHLVSAGGEYKAGDLLLMATDALAMWLLIQLEHEHERPEKIIKLLDRLAREGDEMFTQLVDREKANKQLTDDDITLIIIHL